MACAGDELRRGIMRFIGKCCSSFPEALCYWVAHNQIVPLMHGLNFKGNRLSVVGILVSVSHFVLL